MADVEAALLALFSDLAWTDTIADFRTLPDMIAAHGGVLRIRRIGGGADRDNDQPQISVQAYASPTIDNPRATTDLQDAVWGRFLDILNGSRSGWCDLGNGAGVLIEDPSKTSGPVTLSSPVPTITVVESLYSLTIRQ